MHLDLDTVAWRSDEPTVRLELEGFSGKLDGFTNQHPQWVIEGCYADLMEPLTIRATKLIFIDRSVASCQAHARNRPWEPHKYPSKEAQDTNLEMLLGWIVDYPQREGPLGRPAHEKVFVGRQTLWLKRRGSLKDGLFDSLRRKRGAVLLLS